MRKLKWQRSDWEYKLRANKVKINNLETGKYVLSSNRCFGTSFLVTPFDKNYLNFEEFLTSLEKIIASGISFDASELTLKRFSSPYNFSLKTG